MNVMFTQKDFEEAIVKKLANEAYKTYVRTNYSPEQADAICNAVDAGERTEHFAKMYSEFTSMLAQYWNQQQAYMQLLSQRLRNQ